MPDSLDKLLPAKVIERAYDDIASPPAKELGKAAAEIVKTARLLLAPFQLAAAFQDRFERVVEKIRSRVPEERQKPAAGEVIGPALRQMQYLDEENPLWKMFEELITQAVDSETAAKVHPSFAFLIAQMSRDEGLILYRLRNSEFKVVDTLDYVREQNKFVNRRIESSSIPTNDLAYPNQMNLYYSHLESLSLVEWPVEKQDPIMKNGLTQVGVRRYSTMRLTEFGRLFVSVCVPERGFEGS
ncbi:MAG: Abi-alpha family protein [Polaromonas sp.]|uniref:Abi-alpha family protein n=1 Tax=Polaromonas sp. TaxID=1869339 RepID=UPI004036F6E3